mmetsp:Transcript_24939/g.24408  ORF Transcript_24939/g.24408 Transcript_24939/m.24408 type:complete len:192 (+) Transcript_24939:2-577(+)
MDLKCIFYSEFNYITGPELLYQHPDNFLSNQLFRDLSFYIIPNKQLCGKLSTFQLTESILTPESHGGEMKHDLAYMGLPIEILNKKYERKSYEFNLGIIVGAFSLHDQNTRNIYEQTLRKMATYLTILEEETEFLWLSEKKVQVKDVVRELFRSLIVYQEHPSDLCLKPSFCIPFDQSNQCSIEMPKKYTH